MFGMKPDRVRTIYSGIDFSSLDRPWDVDRARNDAAVPTGWKTVLFVGRLDDAKAPNLLIDAFARVVAARPQTALVVVGSGDLEPLMRERMQHHQIADHIRFMGLRDDVPAFLRIADVFALSSLWEGVGRAMTEAMLCGLPVVVPEIYGIPEIVRHDETGLLYPRGDIAALADGIVRLLERPDDAHRLGAAGRTLTRRIFDADYMVRSIDEVYDELLAARRAA
jgi:glycosyltransferase involved in cell wall biosynthesis